MNSTFIYRAFWGLLLIVVGVLFLLDQTGVRSFNIWELFGTYWPLIVIYFSLIGILFQRKVNGGWFGNYFWNFVWLFVGLYFLGRNLGYIRMSIGELIPYIFPVALIIVGIYMITRPKQKDESKSTHPSHTSQTPPREEEESIPFTPEEPISNFDEQFEARFGSEEPTEQPGPKEEPRQQHARAREQRKRARENNWNDHEWDWNFHTGSQVENRSGFIGDVKIGQDYYDLKPLNISLFIGDVMIDLTKATIPYGETKINISSFIGDVKIFVPNDLDLEISVVSSSFLGDNTIFERHEGGLFRNMVVTPQGYEEADKKIRINVSTFIGDLRVQRVG